MSLYAIVLDKEDTQVWENVRKNWPAPNHHIYDERVAFVKEDTLLTGQISEKAGIGKDCSGIAVQMDYYAGFSGSQLVEWLKKNNE